MKKLFVGILMVMVVGMVGVVSAGDKIYTGYNIWIDKNIKCINYKMGDNFIPVGTELKYIKITHTNENDYYHYTWIDIKLKNNKNYKIYFTSKWHKPKKIRDYVNYLSTKKTFDEMTKNMTALEITAIKKGKIVVGMSKEAVLLSYGIPPEHRTPNLESNRWRYWMNKRKQKIIYFYNNKAVTRSKYERLNRDLEIKNVKEL